MCGFVCLSLGEKPYECPDCHERFARNSTLKCHMAACQNGAGAKKGRKKLYECQVQFVQNLGHQVLLYQCGIYSRKNMIQICNFLYVNIFIHLMQKDIMSTYLIYASFIVQTNVFNNVMCSDVLSYSVLDRGGLQCKQECS